MTQISIIFRLSFIKICYSKKIYLDRICFFRLYYVVTCIIVHRTSWVRGLSITGDEKSSYKGVNVSRIFPRNKERVILDELNERMHCIRLRPSCLDRWKIENYKFLCFPHRHFPSPACYIQLLAGFWLFKTDFMNLCYLKFKVEIDLILFKHSFQWRTVFVILRTW